MKYDFTTIMDRRGHDAMAVDGLGNGSAPGAPKDGFDAIPMWVADMNFPTCPSIIEAMEDRLKQHHFGYFRPRDEYYESIIKWHETRNGVRELKPEHIGYENGVLGGVATALSVFCSKGDKVLLHRPTYVGFTGTLHNAGYEAVHTDLKIDENGIWRMDFEDMEKKLAEGNIHAAILCSPHNPTGRVWDKWELEKAMELFAKYDVYVISDEIWSDILTTGYKHVPTQSVSEDAKMRTVALYAPSKTFNLAGLTGSYHIIYNKWIRDRIAKEASLSHYNSMNLLSMYALIGAYKSEGGQWVDELREVITGNIDFALEFIKDNFPGVKCIRPQGTYMLFVDCGEYCAKYNVELDTLINRGHEVGVAWQDGRMFFGKCHIRINLALPLTRVKEAFGRMKKYVFID